MSQIMNYIITGLVTLALSAGAYLGIESNQPQQKLGVFGDPFLSIQLATNPSNGNCLTTDGTNNEWENCAAGGGSGGGTFSTSTNAAYGGVLNNYANNATDIVEFGGTSGTTTADYWFDPNTNTSYLVGKVGIGTSTGMQGTLNIYHATFPLVTMIDGSQVSGQRAWGLRINGGTFQIVPYNDAGSATSNILSLTRLGMIGVGSSTPNNKITIYSTATPDLGFSGAAGDTLKWTLGVKANTTGNFCIASSTAIGTNDRLCIDGAGHTLIATSTSGTNFLAVGGDVDVTGTTTTRRLDLGAYSQRQFVVEGDSFSNDGGYDWPYFLASTSPYFAKAIQTNYALAGDTCSAMVGEYATQGHLSRPTKYGDDYTYFVWCGLNDIFGSAAASTVYGDLKTIWSAARSDGYKVVAFTITYATSTTAAKEAERQALNNLILSDPSLYDYVIQADKVLDPRINNLYWMPDGTHPNPDGINILADVVVKTMEKRPYQMTPANGTSTSPTKFDTYFNNGRFLVGSSTASSLVQFTGTSTENSVFSVVTSASTTALNVSNAGIVTAPYASTTVVSSSANAYFATAGGVVGVGITNPNTNAKLQVSYGANNNIFLGNQTSLLGLSLGLSNVTSGVGFSRASDNSITNGIFNYNDTGGLPDLGIIARRDIGFFGNTTQTGIMKLNGDVAFGSTSPSSGFKFTLNGDFYLAGKIFSTSTAASIFPYASTTALSVGGRTIAPTYDKTFAWASSTPDANFKSYNTATSSRVIWLPTLPTGLASIGCKVTGGSGTAHVAIGNGTASTTLPCTTTYASLASSVTWTAGSGVYIAASSTAPNGVQDLVVTGAFYNI